MALLIFAVLSLLVAGELQAGVVVGGTRFIFPADRESISILLTNTSQESWLINSKINRPTRWAGGEASTVPAPLLAAPPLILLKPGTTGTLRLLRTESDILPVDRETLFELSIASVPSGKVENQSVKVAMRSVFKLFWRPEGLPGDPLEAPVAGATYTLAVTPATAKATYVWTAPGVTTKTTTTPAPKPAPQAQEDYSDLIPGQELDFSLA